MTNVLLLSLLPFIVQAQIYPSPTEAFGQRDSNYSSILSGPRAFTPEQAAYIRQYLPYRNGTEYPLRYSSFNLTNSPGWHLRWNTADNYLPSNLSSPGLEKVVVTSYALLWDDSSTYPNLSSKISPDTYTPNGFDQPQAPNMCIGYMGSDTDFTASVKNRIDVKAADPCSSLFGEKCLSSLTTAFTAAYVDGSPYPCTPQLGRLEDLDGCKGTWDKKTNWFSFFSGLIANGTRFANGSFADSPEWNDVVGQEALLHVADDNSTYEKELDRTQIFVVKESGKDAQILCMRFEGSALRLAAGCSWLLVAGGVVLAMISEMW